MNSMKEINRASDLSDAELVILADGACRTIEHEAMKSAILLSGHGIEGKSVFAVEVPNHLLRTPSVWSDVIVTDAQEGEQTSKASVLFMQAKHWGTPREALSPEQTASNPVPARERVERRRSPCVMPDFPRFWDLFAYLLPSKIRAQAYEPALQELREDYLVARRRYRTNSSRRWLTLCFTVRTALLVVQSFRVLVGDRALRFLRWLAIGILGDGAIRLLRGFFEVMRRG